MATASEAVWFRDPLGLLSDDRIARFVPLPNTQLAEQLNAVMRFALYYAAAMLLLRRVATAIYVPLLVGGLTYLVFTADESARKHRAPELGEELDPVSGRACTKPNRENPYMNVLISDYQKRPSRAPACDARAPRTRKRAEKAYEHNLYRDVDDVFKRNTSSRQFYTTPSTTIPNDQDAFARWLYSTGPTCKEQGGVCQPRPRSGALLD